VFRHFRAVVAFYDERRAVFGKKILKRVLDDLGVPRFARQPYEALPAREVPHVEYILEHAVNIRLP